MLVSWGTHAQNTKLDSRASFTVRDVSWIPSNGTEWSMNGDSSIGIGKDRGTMDHARLILIGRLIRVPTNEVIS
jgi:hypothetical protein